MKFDILFLDATCHKTYQQDSLENDSLGGTEYATIRLAEGFAAKGHKVCVIQRWDRLPSKSTNGVVYAPHRWFTTTTATNTIHIRSVAALPDTTQSNNIVWLHDVGAPYMADWNVLIDAHKPKIICQSDWHVENLRSMGLLGDIKRIYPPLDQRCIDYPHPTQINSHQLVWMSSPHKGLQECIAVFEKLRALDSRFKLAVFNPGYLSLAIDNIDNKNIRLLSESSRIELKAIVSHSLCMLYPTYFEETYGSVAAECNALGVPVAHYGIAGLNESCNTEKRQDEKHLIETILEWSIKPIKAKVNPEFSFESVYKDWAKILV